MVAVEHTKPGGVQFKDSHRTGSNLPSVMNVTISMAEEFAGVIFVSTIPDSPGWVKLVFWARASGFYIFLTNSDFSFIAPMPSILQSIL